MKQILAITLLALILSSFACGERSVHGGPTLSLDEKHRLYSAALAASESPLDTESFKDVCRTIGIFDVQGKPNDQYMTFVSQHVDWGMKAEANQFRQEINSKDKAEDYIKQQMAAR
jgi:hypothetical protein